MWDETLNSSQSAAACMCPAVLCAVSGCYKDEVGLMKSDQTFKKKYYTYNIFQNAFMTCIANMLILIFFNFFLRGQMFTLITVPKLCGQHYTKCITMLNHGSCVLSD